MKKNFLAFLFAIATICASAQIPNSNFFNWTDDEPDGYLTSNSITQALGIGSNVRTATGQYGSTGIRVETAHKYLFDEAGRLVPIDTIPGFAIQYDQTSKATGFPMTERPMAFSGRIKFEFYKPDTAMVGVTLYKWDDQTKQRGVIGSAIYSISYYSIYGAYVRDYINFDIPFTFTSDIVNPDTAVVSIYSSTTKFPEPGSVIFVDNLAISGITASKNSLMPISINAFPNPAIGQLNITNIPSSAYTIDIRDVTGRLIEVMTSKENVSLKVDGYSNGLYQYSIWTENKTLVYSDKFSVVK